jgi:hypothetical protein
LRRTPAYLADVNDCAEAVNLWNRSVRRPAGRDGTRRVEHGDGEVAQDQRVRRQRRDAVRADLAVALPARQAAVQEPDGKRLSGKGAVTFPGPSRWRRATMSNLTRALHPVTPQPAPASTQFDPATTAANLAAQKTAAQQALPSRPGATQQFPPRQAPPK